MATATVTPEVETPEDTTPESTESEIDPELLAKALAMNIKPYVPAEKANIYDDQVDTLLKVDEATGHQNLTEILVPEKDVLKHKRYFSQAAAKRDKTSRIVNGDKGVAQGDGGRLLAFVLEPKRHRKDAGQPRKAKTDDTPEAV